jgi:hypothetical protein
VPKACRVVAVDVGSVRGNFAWAALDLPMQTIAGQGADPEGAVSALLAALGRGLPTALGFEAPLSVPVPAPDPEAWPDLGRARAGEGSRSWSAGAGTGALATGLAEMAWMIGRLHAALGEVRVTTSASAWTAGSADLFIWEAFVSGPGKPPPKCCRAARGGCRRRSPDFRRAVPAAAIARVRCRLRSARGPQPGLGRCPPRGPSDRRPGSQCSPVGLRDAPGCVEVLQL